MEMQVKRSVAKLPVVCFNRGDELTIEGYMVKVKALSGGEVELTSEDKKKLEYSLRVFKGLAASAATQRSTRGYASQKKNKANGKTRDGNRKSRTRLSGRRLRRRFSGGPPGVPRAATGQHATE